MLASIALSGLKGWKKMRVAGVVAFASPRDKAFALSAISSVLAKAIAVLTMFVSVPLTLHYLGTERYGLWLTVSSFSMMCSFADLGLGNGMLTAIAARSGLDDLIGVRRIISSGYAALAAVAFVLIVGFLLVRAHVAWDDVLSVKSIEAKAEAGPAIAVFVICFALAIPLTVIQKIQGALQQGYRSSAWQSAGSLLSLVLVLLSIWLKLGLPWLLLCFVGSPIITSCLNAALFFSGTGRRFMPSLKLVDVVEIRHVMHRGLLFFGTQLIVATSFGFDALIISHQLGASFVPDLAIPERLFALIGLIAALVLQPLWPAYGEAFTRRDHRWILVTYRRSMLATILIVSSMSLGLVFFGRAAIHLWVGAAIHPSLLLLLGLALWRIADALANSTTTLLNGLGALGGQFFAYLALGLVMVPLKFWFVSWFGVTGLPWAACVAYLVAFALPLYLVAKRSLQSLKRDEFIGRNGPTSSNT